MKKFFIIWLLIITTVLYGCWKCNCENNEASYLENTITCRQFLDWIKNEIREQWKNDNSRKSIEAFDTYYSKKYDTCLVTYSQWGKLEDWSSRKEYIILDIMHKQNYCISSRHWNEDIFSWDWSLNCYWNFEINWKGDTHKTYEENSQLTQEFQNEIEFMQWI